MRYLTYVVLKIFTNIMAILTTDWKVIKDKNRIEGRDE